MQGTRYVRFLFWVVSLFLLSAFSGESLAKEAPRLTKDELKGLMGNPDVIIIDVRTKAEWESSKEKIKGAVRDEPAKTVKDWADKYPKDKTFIFYCS